jgi:arginine N-succinyltransferase
MFVVREPRVEDVGQILEVAKHLDTVNLPAREDRIGEIVDLAMRSFSGELDLPEREFLFVLEDCTTNRVIGTSMIHAQHGTKRSPHVYFQVIKEERYSQTLDKYFVHECLRLRYNYHGPTEIAGLILLPQYRGNGIHLGRLLSYVRFLFIAMHRELFRDQVLSELLPPLEADGTSVLWEHLGKRFTGLTYQEADLLSKHDKEFIRALFPHGLIYTSLLPPHVHDVIAQVGPETKGVEKILCRIGFEQAEQIDPFDGGPHFKAITDDITLVKDARTRKVTSDSPGGKWAIAAHRGAHGFRATTATSSADSDMVFLAEGAHECLEVQEGDEVWSVVP